MCRCADLVAAKDACAMLKMADLESFCGVSYTGYPPIIWIGVQPIEYQAARGWHRTYVRRFTFNSIDGLKKGVNRIIQQKINDPSYLALPEPDADGDFHYRLTRHGASRLMRRTRR